MLTPPACIDLSLATLVGIDDRTSYNLAETDTFLGRSLENDIVLHSDLSLSRRHACITNVDGIYYLRDLRSSNGTLLNGLVVEGMAPLKQNDEIYFGRIRFLFNPTVQKLHDTPPCDKTNTLQLPRSPWLKRKTFWQTLQTAIYKIFHNAEKEAAARHTRETVLNMRGMHNDTVLKAMPR